MHFHVTQLEMIEGDKTTTANLFLTNIFFSPKHFVICVTCEFRVVTTTIYRLQQKEILRGRSFTLSCSFFCSIEWQQWLNCKVWQPLEDDTGYKEAKMKAVDSDFDRSVYWTDKTTTMNMATTWNWTEKRNILSHANLFRYFKIFNKCIDFGCMFIVVHKVEGPPLSIDCWQTRKRLRSQIASWWWSKVD